MNNLVKWFEDVILQRELSKDQVNIEIDENEEIIEEPIVMNVLLKNDKKQELIKSKKNFDKIIKVLKKYLTIKKSEIKRDENSKKIDKELLKHKFGKETKKDQELTEKERLEIILEISKYMGDYLFKYKEWKNELNKEEEKNIEQGIKAIFE